MQSNRSILSEKFMRHNLKDIGRYIIPVGILFLYILPLIWFGQDSHILIHDNLDSNIIYFKILAESGQIFGALDAEIPNAMNGLPRNVYGSEFNVILWLYYFFEPYTAYVVNQILMRLIAFWGMYLLLRSHFLKDQSSEWIAIGVALTFSLLPFWPSGGLSVAGQPLAFFAFLNFRESRHSIKDWLIITLVPFYSSLVLSFAFFIAALSLLWFYDWVIGKKFNTIFLLAIATMSVMFLIVEYRLVYSMFIDNSYVSHRSDWVPTGRSLLGSLKSAWEIFINGQYHAHSLHRFIVILSALMAVTVALVKTLKFRVFTVLLLIIVATSGIYGFWGWSMFLPIRENLGLLSAFNFSRFHFLQPLLWYLIFALCLKILYDHIPKYGRNIVVGLLVLQSFYLFYHHDQIQQRNNPSFSEFFSTQLFQEIDEFIGQEKSAYRVVSIGMHPSVSQYNGFYTLDSYKANYPLEYKQQFRRIIEQELVKNPGNRDYFDNWGSRCYIFTAELGRNAMVQKDNNYVIENLELNTSVLYEMGGRYIFSAVEIINSADNNLVLLNVFESDDSCWRVYLYEVQDSNTISRSMQSAMR